MGTHTRRHAGAAVLVAVLLLVVGGAHGYKHTLTVKDDHRGQFFIENFGFTTGGTMSMTVTDWAITPPLTNDKDDGGIYFLLRITKIDTAEYLEESPQGISLCSGNFDNLPGSIPLVQDWKTNSQKNITVGQEGSTYPPGLYNLYFINCHVRDRGAKVSFKLHLEQYNLDPIYGKDYLPVGLDPIPTVYGLFSAAYAVMFFVWIFGFMRGPGKVVNKVHHLMTILIALKFFSMLFYGIEQHNVRIKGVPGKGLEITYLIFAVLKTLFFFVIVTLIGTGWSFFKPFLSDKDKKIIMVVVPLQILDNIAMIIVDEAAPGSVGWFTWKDIFRLVDIICCGAVLIPIIWSIKHLREASQSDGKAARNLQKLRLFRQFYLIVVSYIYFTRIIIYLLDATLQYDLIYLGEVFTELATLSFFLVVGYKFRPVQNNPYFNMEEEDAARMEEMRMADED
jgi:hypothetical protein